MLGLFSLGILTTRANTKVKLFVFSLHSSECPAHEIYLRFNMNKFHTGSPENKFRASAGFEPMTTAILVKCTTVPT